jgi:hypothetical protein
MKKKKLNLNASNQQLKNVLKYVRKALKEERIFLKLF